MEYEEAKHEQESLKKIARDLRSEVRTLKDTNSNLESKVINIELEKENLRTDARSLANLRAEHSKLKASKLQIFRLNNYEVLRTPFCKLLGRF